MSLSSVMTVIQYTTDFLFTALTPSLCYPERNGTLYNTLKILILCVCSTHTCTHRERIQFIMIKTTLATTIFPRNIINIPQNHIKVITFICTLWFIKDNWHLYGSLTFAEWFHIKSYLSPITTLIDKCYYYSHLIEEETDGGRLSNLPKVTS